MVDVFTLFFYLLGLLLVLCVAGVLADAVEDILIKRSKK